MTFETFRQNRVNAYQKKMTKYLTYVFNDHFVLVLLFIFGAAGYFYSEFLKTADRIPPIILFLSILVLTLSLTIGKLATLVEEADVTFLTPLEKDMDKYMSVMAKRSLIIPILFLSFITAMMMPLWVAGHGLVFKDVSFLIPMTWMLKLVHMALQKLHFTTSPQPTEWIVKLAYLGFSFFLLAIAFYVSPMLGFILAMVLYIVANKVINQKIEKSGWKWEKLVEEENKRLFFLYRLINLFTDVPYISSKVKRNKFVTTFMENVYPSKNSPYRMLFGRVFARNASYYGLYFRLLIIGAILQVVSANFIMNGLFALLCLYLIGFQLLPLYSHFEGYVTTAIYPVSEKEKQTDLEQLILTLLIVVAVVFTSFSLFQITVVEALIIFIIEIVFIFGFVHFYIRNRIKKMTLS